jgi:hypothetical protein
MGIPFTVPMGFLFTITIGFLFTIALGIQLTISKPSSNQATRCSARAVGPLRSMCVLPSEQWS